MWHLKIFTPPTKHPRLNQRALSQSIEGMELDPFLTNPIWCNSGQKKWFIYILSREWWRRYMLACLQYSFVHSSFARLPEGQPFPHFEGIPLPVVSGIRSQRQRRAHSLIQSHTYTATHAGQQRGAELTVRATLSSAFCYHFSVSPSAHCSSTVRHMIWSALNGGTLIKKGHGTTTTGSSLRSYGTEFTVPVIAFSMCW